MIYVYNTDEDTYRDLYRQAFESLTEYLGPEEEDTTVYRIMFFMSLSDIFDQAKQRSAFRGRFAKNAQGQSMLENFALTNDEQDIIEKLLPAGATEVFKKLSAWCKEVNDAYQFGVTFGDKNPIGTITSAGGTSVYDATSQFTANALVGYKIVILSSGSELYEEEREILSNTVDTLTIERAFSNDVAGLAYGVYNPEEKFITYALRMNLNWDFNQLQVAETAIKEALIAYELKEWYLANRYMEDYTIEESRFQENLAKTKLALIQGRESWARPTDFFAV